MEGHGEVLAFPLLLRRLASELLHVPYVDVPRPNRQPRSRLLRPGELERAVAFAASRVVGRPGGVLVLLDADDDCPATAAPALLDRTLSASRGQRVAVVLAEREFEGWFLAAAGSLAGKRGFPDDLSDHPAPESVRDAKGWLSRQLRAGSTYAATVDQPALCQLVDLGRARSRSSSFDKLVRSLDHLLRGEP